MGLLRLRGLLKGCLALRLLGGYAVHDGVEILTAIETTFRLGSFPPAKLP